MQRRHNNINDNNNNNSTDERNIALCNISSKMKDKM
jgi:hypothetical protein